MKYISSILAILSASAALMSGPVSAQTTMSNCRGGTVYAVAAQKIYYTKGMTNYGHVKGGQYMCKSTARSKGYKEAKPGTMKSSM